MRKIFHQATQKIDELRNRIAKMSREEKKSNHTKSKTPSSKESDRMIVDLSLVSIAKATIVVLAIFYLFQFIFLVGQILLLLFISMIIASMLDPWVDWMESNRIPRALGTFFLYLILFALVGVIVSYYIPLIASQLFDLGRTLTGWIQALATDGVTELPFYDRFAPYINQIVDSMNLSNIESYFDNLYLGAKNFTSTALGLVTSLAGGLAAAVTALAISFYMVVDEKSIENFIHSVTPTAHEDWATTHMTKVRVKMGAWLRSQLMLCIIVGMIVWIGLSVLGVPYAATLGLIAGITEFMPVIGPIIAGVPAFLVAALAGGFMPALLTLIFFAILNSIESNIFVPIIMKHAVGLSPIIVIIAMLIGGMTMGIIGIILSVPIATAISVFIMDFSDKEKLNKA